MIIRRLRQASLLILSAAIVLLGFFQMFMRVQNGIPTRYITLLAVTGLLFAVFWGVLSKLQPYSAETILPCVLLLCGIGILMIARIDNQRVLLGAKSSNLAPNQLIWLCVALVLCTVLVAFLRDYRILRRFSYVSMVVGLALLLSPMIPGLGMEIQGARIWIGIGSHSLQPAEFAKLFLAFFFAAYLFDHRDQLAVGGKKVMGFQLPRIKDLGPILVVWAVCMGVLVMQHDLGTSLMFFAMFVSMLYVATGRKSWIVIGLAAFVIGAVLAASLFSHVGNRVNAWLHPFDSKVYLAIGGSQQLVQGIFGLATGGLMGVGLGQGHPTSTPLSWSDFIYSSLGEELGMTGLFAILALYLIIISAGMVTAMKIKDGFGKLLASGLVFTMAFQVFTVVGGITLVIPLTGLTLPYMAAGGSSLIANCILASLLMVISNAANKPEEDLSSDTFQYEALMAIREKEKQATLQAQLQSEADAEAHEMEAQARAAQEQAQARTAQAAQAAQEQARQEQELRQAREAETMAIVTGSANRTVPEPPAPRGAHSHARHSASEVHAEKARAAHAAQSAQLWGDPAEDAQETQIVRPQSQIQQPYETQPHDGSTEAFRQVQLRTSHTARSAGSHTARTAESQPRSAESRSAGSQPRSARNTTTPPAPQTPPAPRSAEGRAE
ncbi:cell division protein FtsW [Bifidobacterium simiarum]|uniref:Cell division protein FtsW n=1 Tax=Bifidobacterium simiarum TaxID=2045441 RepID=A0A2M9HCB9_9BIFI|nr:FtsW/RodA/SpoVE family cell cycle protein [Bifidobacterium simiarum]PJM74454.1 cell division protein FtsW [Bifidobacterium simiarum]